ncbi:MAG: dihydrofolate reductase [Marinilabiliales bacterium]
MKTNKKISIIVAVAENNAIGYNNKLLCHLSDDLKRFKKLTTGNVVVMGKKTYESLPIKPLPNRLNIVITDNPADCFDNCITAFSIEDAIDKMDPEKENFIIGGGSVYKQFLPLADKLYLTRIHHHFDADTFFPEINENEWILVNSDFHKADDKNEYDYTYMIFNRKS